MPNWTEVLTEICELRNSDFREAQAAADIIRRRYLEKLYRHTGRNVIAYYSGWLSKPGIAQAEITDEDMNGFMMSVHRLDSNPGA